MPNTVQEVIKAVMDILLTDALPAHEKEFQVAKLMGVLDMIDKFGGKHENRN